MSTATQLNYFKHSRVIPRTHPDQGYTQHEKGLT